MHNKGVRIFSDKHRFARWTYRRIFKNTHVILLAKELYPDIQEYVLKEHNLKVSTLYIAQVKQKYGIFERECYNKANSENTKQPQCSIEKEEAIGGGTETF